MLDIACDTQVWTEQPQVISAEKRPRGKRGGQPKKPLVVGTRQRIDQIAAALPASAWKRVMVSEGSQGPRMYEYAAWTVWFCEDELPGPAERLLVRRSAGQSVEVKYHRSNAPAEVPLEKLAAVRGLRWTIEKDIQSCKGECGLDEYETRGWVGWRHHTALSVLAWLWHLLDVRRWEADEILRWSKWRRQRNHRAAQSHSKQRLTERRSPPSKRKKPAL